MSEYIQQPSAPPCANAEYPGSMYFDTSTRDTDLPSMESLVQNSMYPDLYSAAIPHHHVAGVSVASQSPEFAASSAAVAEDDVDVDDAAAVDDELSSFESSCTNAMAMREQAAADAEAAAAPLRSNRPQAFGAHYATNDKRYQEKKGERLVMRTGRIGHAITIDADVEAELDESEKKLEGSKEGLPWYSWATRRALERKEADERAQQRYEDAVQAWNGAGIMPSKELYLEEELAKLEHSHGVAVVAAENISGFMERLVGGLANAVDTMGAKLFVEDGVGVTVIMPGADANSTNAMVAAGSSSTDDGGVVERQSGFLSSLLKKISVPYVERPSKRELMAMENVDMQKDLGCKTIHEALKKRVNLQILKKCNLPPSAYIDECVSIDELQRCGLTLYDVHNTLGVDWATIVRMGLRSVHLTRENRWFDTRTLADCAAREQADFVAEIGFDTQDIFRLHCTDLEMAQLGFDMDSIIEKLGLQRKEFLALPWYLETMVDLLGLEKEHLMKKLCLKRRDYVHLMKYRKWTARNMQELLDFDIDELAAISTTLSPSASSSLSNDDTTDDNKQGAWGGGSQPVALQRRAAPVSSAFDRLQVMPHSVDERQQRIDEAVERARLSNNGRMRQVGSMKVGDLNLEYITRKRMEPGAATSQQQDHNEALYARAAAALAEQAQAAQKRNIATASDEGVPDLVLVTAAEDGRRSRQREAQAQT